MTMLQHSNGYRTISLTIAGLLAMAGMGEMEARQRPFSRDGFFARERNGTVDL